MKRKKLSGGNLWLLLAVLLVAASVFALWPRDDAEHQLPESKPTVPVQTVQLEQTPTESTALELEIETPYGTLFFPNHWPGQIETEIQEEPGKYTVTFLGTIAGKRAQLFAVVFGGTQEMPLGKLLLNDGTEVVVRLDLERFEPDASWTEAELKTAYAMIEGSTLLVETLSQQDNFE